MQIGIEMSSWEGHMSDRDEMLEEATYIVRGITCVPVCGVCYTNYKIT